MREWNFRTCLCLEEVKYKSKCLKDICLVYQLYIEIVLVMWKLVSYGNLSGMYRYGLECAIKSKAVWHNPKISHIVVTVARRFAHG